MSLADGHVWLPYLAVAVAAAVEGEIAYVAACVLVARGDLQALGVVLAGATGAAIGDQAYFYVLRGPAAMLLARLPGLQRRAEPMLGRVRRHPKSAALLIRFAPGLRIALAVACATVRMPAMTFSLINGASAVLWAIVVLAIVAWMGPAGLARMNLPGWVGGVIAGLVVLLVVYLFSRHERRALSN